MRVQRVALGDLDEGQHLFVIAGGPAHHGGLNDLRVIVDRGLYLRRVDIEPAVDDQLFRAAQDVQVTVFVERPQIAGAQPAILAEDFGGFLGVLVVALHDVGPTGQDLALAIAATFDGIIDFSLDTGQGRTDRDIGRSQRVAGGRDTGGGFRHAIAVLDRDAVKGFGLALPRGVQRCRPRRDIAQRFGVELRQPLLFRVLHQQRVHLRHGRQEVHPRGQRGIELFSRETRLQPDFGTGAAGGGHDRTQPENMGQGQHAIDHIARIDPPQRRRGIAAKAHVGMGQHDALRVARCTGSIKQHRHIAQIPIRVAGDRGGQMHRAEGTGDLCGTQPFRMGCRIG